MREICDKHFSDNWVIPIYNGVLVDLSIYWKTFAAAAKALLNNITEAQVLRYAKFFTNMVRKSNERIKLYLVDGQL
jgi:WASH complex subunit strumpellin